MQISEFLSRNKKIIFILLLGLMVRMAFLLWGAEIYFNRSDIHSQGDTRGWAIGFEQFIEKGAYTVNPGHELGYFGRLPGYSFFIGIFYFIAGGDWSKALPIVAWVQLLLDFFSILLIYRITKRLFSENSALLAAGLYAIYPFTIVWIPVAHTETVSLFLMLTGFLFLTGKDKRIWLVFIAGLFFGLGALMRPQMILLIPFLFLFLLLKNALTRQFVLRGVALGLGLLLTYGMWPARNYINHGKVIFAQELKGYGDYWDVDVISFMQYTFSVKTEWEPQFTTIVENQPTPWPAHAYLSEEDSLLLERAVYLSKNCGFGFSRRTGYWKAPISREESCSEEIESLFNHLRQRQMQENPLSFYLFVPLQNLKKALFKTQLTEKPDSRLVSSFVTMLFLYRSLLLFMGVIGCIIFFRKGNYFPAVILLYFVFLYFTLCFGTTVQMRNIEMRYFLHADVLLLIPASMLIMHFYDYAVNRLRKNITPKNS